MGIAQWLIDVAESKDWREWVPTVKPNQSLGFKCSHMPCENQRVSLILDSLDVAMIQ